MFVAAKVSLLLTRALPAAAVFALCMRGGIGGADDLIAAIDRAVAPHQGKKQA